jgi:hypothetical protein
VHSIKSLSLMGREEVLAMVLLLLVEVVLLLALLVPLFDPLLVENILRNTVNLWDMLLLLIMDYCIDTLALRVCSKYSCNEVTLNRIVSEL